MSKYSFFALLLLSAIVTSGQKSRKQKGSVDTAYFPPSGSWIHQSPSVHHFDSVKLYEAVRFAIEHESKQPRNLELAQAMTFGKEPFGEAIGPFSDRGDPTGLIIHKGYIIAQWGDPNRVEMTHSVTKSFLSTVIGLAVDEKIISNISDTVINYLSPIEVYSPTTSGPDPNMPGQASLLEPFSSAHNRILTWDVMLRQTSDWEGSLWGKPDWADRPDADPGKWMNRERRAPGSAWEYNDVRVNALALAATCVWRKPLPAVLKAQIMDPIGASSSWRWYGYRNSWIVLDGMIIQSVSGGGHWGGGLFINAFDMARFGLLTLHEGNWNGKQLISKKWIAQSRQPTNAQPTYGYMNYFLNTDKKYYPNAPASAFAHIGNGANIIYVDPDHELVIVVRWIEASAMNEMIGKLMEAMK
jgi:CubicO group peptidase (beta-lactamase class C family)